MFTKTELNVLHSALESWKGIYPKYIYNQKKLNETEKEYHKKMLKISDNLKLRIEEILQEYYNLENHTHSGNDIT